MSTGFPSALPVTQGCALIYSSVHSCPEHAADRALSQRCGDQLRRSAVAGVDLK